MNPRPRTRDELVVVQQTYRGDETYIVKDPRTHKYFRFRPIEMMVLQEFDGERTFAEVAGVLQEQGLAFTPEAVGAFARKLNGMGLFERGVAEKSVLLMERLRAQRTKRIKAPQYQGSLMRMRWSVGDPDKMLERWLPRLRFFFSRPFMILSVFLFIAYVVIFVTQFPRIAAGLATLYSPTTLTLQAFVVFWVTGLTVIAIHELGHGFTCKYFGGQVHEMGAMLIYFQPAFYCNVNDAWTFTELKPRLWVTAAGTWIQLVIAGLAGIAWLIVEPNTLISQIALSALVVGGTTTVLANANPLIPLDGYYALSDYLEIPNLRHRAFDYLSWLVKHHVLRIAVPRPQVDEREQRVFLTYGLLAVAYITIILAFLGSLVFGWASRTFGVIGIIVFLFLLWTMLRDGVRNWAGAIVTSFREHKTTWRSAALWKRVGLVALVVVVLGFVIPWPVTVGGTFAVAPRAEMALAAGADGVVDRVFAGEGVGVSAGDPIVRLRNFALEQDDAVLSRAVDSLRFRATEARAFGRIAVAEQLEAERAEAAAAQAAIRARLATLTVRAPSAGVVATPRLEETVGRRLEAGDVVVRLIERDELDLRVELEPAGATLVRPGQPVRLIAYTNLARTIHAAVSTVSSAASDVAGENRIEARVRLAAEVAGVRPGARGEARVVIRQGSLWGAMWWGVRKRVRSDILL